MTSSATSQEQALEASHPRKVAVALLAAKVAVLTLLVDERGLSSVDLPRVLASRALAWGLVASLVLLVLQHGPGVFPRARLHLAVLAVVVAHGLSLLGAQDRYLAFYGATQRYLGVLWLLDMVILYLAACVVLRTRRDVLLLAGTVVVAAAVSVSSSFLQFLGQEDPVWLAAGGRASGWFGNPNTCAQFMAAVASAGVAVALTVSHRRKERAAAAACAALAAACVGLTGARGGVLGLVAGAGVALFSSLRAQGRAPGKRWDWVVVAAVLALLIIVTPAGSRLTQLQAALDDRLVIWEPVWREFLARPWLGFGPDGTGVGFPAFRGEGMYARLAVSPDVDQAHNWVLQAAVTTGVVGVAALLAWVAGSVALLWRACVQGRGVVAVPLLAVLAAYWTNALVTVESVTVAWIPWLVAGAAVALVRQEPLDLSPPVRLPAWAHGVAWLLAAAGGLGGYTTWAANRAGQEAVTSLRSGDLEGAAQAATTAILLDGGRAEYWNYRGLARGQLGQREGALQDLETAARKAPWRAGYWGNVARIHADLAASGGHADTARAAARRGVELDPFSPTVHRTSAQVARALGDDLEALRECVTAIRLHPADGSCDELVVWAAARVPRPEALPLLEEARTLRPASALLRAGAGDLP